MPLNKFYKKVPHNKYCCFNKKNSLITIYNNKNISNII